MSFEELLQEVGNFGKYQKRFVLIFIAPVFSWIPSFWLNIVFMFSVPDHWCRVPAMVSSNLTVQQQRFLISPASDPSCSMFQRNYSYLIEHPDSIYNIQNETLVVTPCDDGWEYDKTNYFATAATKYDMVCSRSYLPSLLFTVQNIGSLVLVPLSGLLADRFGRKIVFMYLVIYMCLIEIASLLVNDLNTFILLRGLKGHTTPMFIQAYIILMEIVAPEVRTHMNSFLTMCWTFGMSVMPLFAYLTRDWIIFDSIGIVFGCCFLFYWRFLPESPSWCLTQGRYEEAAKTMANIAEVNGKSTSYSYLLEKLTEVGEKIERRKQEEDKVSGCVLFKFPRLRRNFLVLSIAWSTYYVVYTGFLYNISNLNGNEFVNFFLVSAVDFPSIVVFWFLMHRFGRRWTASLGYISLGLICLVPLADFPYVDIVCSMIGSFMIAGLFMVTDQQSTELLPTVINSSGVSIGRTFANVISMASPYMVYFSQSRQHLSFIVMSCFALSAGVLTAFLPETLNAELPHTLTDADQIGRGGTFFGWKRNTRNDAVNKAPVAETEKKSSDKWCFSL